MKLCPRTQQAAAFVPVLFAAAAENIATGYAVDANLLTGLVAY